MLKGLHCDMYWIILQWEHWCSRECISGSCQGCTATTTTSTAASTSSCVVVTSSFANIYCSSGALLGLQFLQSTSIAKGSRQTLMQQHGATSLLPAHVGPVVRAIVAVHQPEMQSVRCSFARHFEFLPDATAGLRIVVVASDCEWNHGGGLVRAAPPSTRVPIIKMRQEKSG